MPTSFIIDRVQMYMDSTLYGYFVMLFTVSNVVLKKRRRTLEVQLNKQSDSWKDDDTRAQRTELRFWLALGSIMLMLTSFHWAFAWGTALAPVNDRKTRGIMSFMRLVFEMLSIFVGDALVLHRLWTIGSKRFSVVAVPLLCFVGFIVCAIRLIVFEVPHLLRLLPNPESIRWWFLSMMALTTCVNIYSTGFIAWKAWSANKIRRKSIYQRIIHILSVIVESAAIYTTWTIILLVIISTKGGMGLWSLLLPVSPALYGCTMMLISVRLGLGWALGLGGKAATRPKSLVMQFAGSVHSDMDEITGYSYTDHD